MQTSPLSTRPYLIRAIHEWCIDQGLTPYIVVHVSEGVMVPSGYANDGQIVLNLDPGATNGLSIGDEGVSFQARFGGVAHDLWIPYPNLLAIYARENGRGLAFTQGVAFELNPEGDHSGIEEVESDAAEVSELEDAPVEAQDKTPPPEDSAPRGGRGSHLKVIK